MPRIVHRSTPPTATGDDTVERRTDAISMDPSKMAFLLVLWMFRCLQVSEDSHAPLKTKGYPNIDVCR